MPPPQKIQRAQALLKPHRKRRNRGLLVGLALGLLAATATAYITGPNPITGTGVEWLGMLFLVLGVGGGLGIWWKTLQTYQAQVPAHAVELVDRWMQSGQPEAPIHPLQSLVDELAGKGELDPAELALMQEAVAQASALTEERAALTEQLTERPALQPTLAPVLAEIDEDLAALEESVASMYAESRGGSPAAEETVERLKARTEVARSHLLQGQR